MRLCLGDVPDLEIEEREAFQGARMMRRDPDRHVPFVERALVVVLVGQDACQQVVRVGEMRMPLEPVHRHAQRRIELTLAPQRLAQPQEHETLRILGELGGEAADVVSHG